MLLNGVLYENNGEGFLVCEAEAVWLEGSGQEKGGRRQAGDGAGVRSCGSFQDIVRT